MEPWMGPQGVSPEDGFASNCAILHFSGTMPRGQSQ
jgi:hypothetical protein